MFKRAISAYLVTPAGKNAQFSDSFAASLQTVQVYLCKELFSRIVLYEYVYCMQGRHALVIFEGARVCVCVWGGGGSISDIVSNIEKDNLTIFCLLEVTFKIHLA